MSSDPAKAVGTIGQYVVEHPQTMKAGACVLAATSAGILVGSAVFLRLQPYI